MNNFIHVMLLIKSCDPLTSSISIGFAPDGDTNMLTLPCQKLATLRSKETAVMLCQKYISSPMSWYNISPMSFFDIGANIYLVYIVNLPSTITFKNGVKLYNHDEIKQNISRITTQSSTVLSG